MHVTPTTLPEVLLITPRRHEDERGYFEESWNQSRYSAGGILGEMVQDNISYSRRDVLRGLHFQLPHGQAKLISVLQGEIFDVAVDIRRASPRFGQWFGTILSAEQGRQIFVPAGFAHGFCTLSAVALVAYKCTAEYAPAYERGIAWNDSDLKIAWPSATPILSLKDAALPCLMDIPSNCLPAYEEGADVTWNADAHGAIDSELNTVLAGSRRN